MPRKVKGLGAGCPAGAGPLLTALLPAPSSGWLFSPVSLPSQPGADWFHSSPSKVLWPQARLPQPLDQHLLSFTPDLPTPEEVPACSEPLLCSNGRGQLPLPSACSAQCGGRGQQWGHNQLVPWGTRLSQEYHSSGTQGAMRPARAAGGRVCREETGCTKKLGPVRTIPEAMEATSAFRQRPRSPTKGRISPTAAGWGQAPGQSPTALLSQDLRWPEPYPLLPQK